MMRSGQVNSNWRQYGIYLHFNGWIGGQVSNTLNTIVAIYPEESAVTGQVESARQFVMTPTINRVIAVIMVSP